MQELKELSVGALQPSPTNPRKNLGDITELVESVRTKGLIEPIVARPLNGRGTCEIVCGHRRAAAAKAAGLASVPVLVRELDDDQVLDLQLAENIDRADLSPLEEAEAYALRLERGQSVQHVAERIGRTPAYVAQRLRLTELSKACRAALAAGKITLGVALVLARVPQHKLQDEALGWAQGTDWEQAPTAKAVAEDIRERYMLKLADAPFDRADPELVKGAPACTVCPKRTGNQAELFSDVDSPDLCTDPICYRAKLDAKWKLIAAEAKKGGQNVLPAKEAQGLFSAHGNGLGYSAKWVDFDGFTYGPGYRQVKVKKLLGKDAETTLARNPHTGKIHQLVPKDVVTKALGKLKREKAKADGDGEKKAREKLTPQQRAAKERDKLKAEAQTEVRKRCLAEIVSCVEAPHWNDYAELFGMLLPPLVEALYEGVELVEERRGLRHDKSGKHRGPAGRGLLEAAKGASVEWLRGVVVELVLADAAEHPYGTNKDAFDNACKAFLLDVKAIEKSVVAELKAKREAENATPKNGAKARKSVAGQIAKAQKATRRAARKPKASVEPAVDDFGNELADEVCRGCGCSELDPCPGGCAWAKPGLCTNCVGDKPKGRKAAPKGERERRKARIPGKPGSKAKARAATARA